MRFKQFIENDEKKVIDATDKFKQKRSDDFSTKVQSVVDGIPNTFKKQADLEKHVANELERINNEMNERLKKYMLKLAPVRAAFREGVSIPDLIYFNNEPGDDHYDMAKKFMDEHGQEVIDTVEYALRQLQDLKRWADSEKWPAGPASLMRDTRFGYALHHISQGVLPVLRQMVKHD